jgi:uncharacterized membrane protein
MYIRSHLVQFEVMCCPIIAFIICMACDVSLDFRHYALNFTAASKSSSASEVPHMLAVAACFAAFREEQFDEILKLANKTDAPTSNAFQSDGWWTKTATICTKRVDGILIKRTGFTRNEHLLEIQVLKTISVVGNITMCTSAPEFSKLASDSGWVIFKSACGATPMSSALEAHGGERVQQQWYLQDGLHSAAFARDMRARHHLYHRQVAYYAGTGEAGQRCGRCWTGGMRCCFRSASSGLKWGMTPYSSKDILDAVHITIQSCINFSSEILNEIPSVVMSRTRFRQPRMSATSIRTYWALAGVSESSMAEFIAVNPEYDPEADLLYVHLDLEGADEWLDRVVAVLVIAMHWRNFIETRWGGLGRSLRLLGLSLVCGLGGLARQVVKHPNANRFFRNGFYRLNYAGVAMYVVVGMFSTLLLESVIMDLLVDDRFFLKMPQLRTIINDIVMVIENVPIATWTSFCNFLVPGTLGEQLRHQIVSSMHVSLAYFHREAFALLESGFHSLTQGDINQRLRALVLEPPPLDPGIFKVYSCCSMRGLPYVGRFLVLCRDAPCSSQLCEKGLAPAAKMSRHHTLYQQLLLSSGAVLDSAVPLLHSKASDVEVKTLERRIDELEGRPIRYNAYNHFIHLTSTHAANLGGPLVGGSSSVSFAMTYASTACSELSIADRSALVSAALHECQQRERRRTQLVAEMCRSLLEMIAEQREIAVAMPGA